MLHKLKHLFFHINYQKAYNKNTATKRLLSFILVTIFTLAPGLAAATEASIASLEEDMATLKAIYERQYNRHSEPLSLPASIANEYQALLNTSPRSDQKLMIFSRSVRQNIEDFNKAKEIGALTNDISSRFEMCLLLLHLKPDIPANIKAIDATFFDIVESETFVGADLLAFESRYHAALSSYTEDAFSVCSTHQTAFGFYHRIDRMTRDLPDDIKASITPDIEDFVSVLDQALDLTKRQQWTAAKEKFQNGLILGNTLNNRITAIHNKKEEKEQSRIASKISRYEALIEEVTPLTEKIDELESDIRDYIAELEEPCDYTIVDYSCADQCPDVREWDIIFSRYKNVPNYQCLSRCNSAERDKQAQLDSEDQGSCIDEKRRIDSKARRLDSKRNVLIEQYKSSLDEIRALEAEFRKE